MEKLNSMAIRLQKINDGDFIVDEVNSQVASRKVQLNMPESEMVSSLSTSHRNCIK